MANFPTPSQSRTQYFIILGAVKPSLNLNDPNSDFVIRGSAFASFASGIYGDQQKVNNDTWVSSARPEALTLFGQDLAIPQSPATKATGSNVPVPGVNGTVITPGQLTFSYGPTGVLYTNTTGGTVALAVLNVSIQALTAGQNGNVKSPAVLNIVSPPTGIGTQLTLTEDVANGTDAESTDSYRQRLLNRFQQPPAGGNANDYRNFAFAASPAVRTALVRRFGRGLGTVDIYITTGTSDIDNAVTNGIPIVRIPSGSLIATVQAYYDAAAPNTDCPEVFAPTEIGQNVTINVDLAAGVLMSTVPNDPVNNPLNLTVAQLIVREVGRALYKVPVGGWSIPGQTSGFVIAAFIERSVDTWLSAEIDQATGLAIGFIPVLADRQVQMLNPPSWDKALVGNTIVAPNVITVSTPV